MAAASKGSILIVDDTPENLRLLSSMLKNQGYVIRAMINSTMAFKSIQTELPDIILLDINMPDMNGYDVCRQLKQAESTRDIPVIFISALDEVVSKVEAFRVGGADYITKPFQVEEVMARIENQLSIQRARYELKKSEEQFRLLAENAQDIIFRYRFVHPRGFEYISPSVTAILGYTPEEYYADPDFDLKLLHPDSLPQFGVFLESPESYREPIIIRYIRKDGGDVWIEQNHRLIKDEVGRNVAIEAISRDITERKRAEEELKTTYHNLKRLNDRLQDELHMAQRIQQNLLPATKPDWQGVDAACYCIPAHEVGGDLYSYEAFCTDASLPEEKKYVCMVGDVSGKGMPAALLMAITLGVFHSTVAQDMPAAACLQALDQALATYTQTTRQNCAMVYAEITRQDCFVQADLPDSSEHDCPGDYMLRVANAGCIFPLIKRADGMVEWVDVGGLPLGVAVNTQEGYQEAIIPLHVDDILILVTDGIIEAQNDRDNEMFGFERLEQAVSQGPQHSAAAMLQHIQARVEDFAGEAELHDDMTIFVVKV
jgi:PAS domain S-box-containing protein